MSFHRLRLSICLIVFVAVSMLVMGAHSQAKKPVKVVVHRLHAGHDCSSGQILLDGNIVAYSLERPWQGNIPLISSIPTGRYHGFVRTRTADRWRIELTDVPNRPSIQLHVGNFVSDGVGCILVGANLTNDLCTLTPGQSKVAFDKFKLAFAEAAAKAGQMDIGTPVEVVIEGP